MQRLKDKIAVITGGSSGIGLASAHRFVAEGATVYQIGRRMEELNKAVADIGDRAIAIQGDVAVKADMDRAFGIVGAQHRRVDVLFANAGLGAAEPLGSITEEALDHVLSVNVKGTVFTVQAALPFMSEGGSIILTGSTTGSMGAPAFSIYSASKAAIRNFARCWAVDLKDTGIRINVLSPGPTLTPAIKRIDERRGGTGAAIDEMISQTVIGRMGKPEEIASVALFLASSDSSFMTGSEVFADGGTAQV